MPAWGFRNWHVPPASQYRSEVQSESLVQPAGHDAAPLHTNGAHDGLAPGWPVATTVQVPGVALQTSQPPEQALLQQ